MRINGSPRLPAGHGTPPAPTLLELRVIAASDISAGAVVCGVTVLRQVLMDRSGVYLFGRHLRCFAAFWYPHESGKHWGHAGVTRIDLHFRKRARCIVASSRSPSPVENYGRIFGGWLIGIDPSLERINLTARCARPSWPLRSLQRGRTP